MLDSGRSVDGERLGVSRRDALKTGAVFGGAVLWVSPVVQSIGISRAWAQQPSPVDVNCWMTGGGQVKAGTATLGGGDTGGGFTLRCGEPVPDNFVAQLGNGCKFQVKVGTPVTVVCSDRPGFDPGHPDTGGFDTVTVTGTGTYTCPGGAEPQDATLFLKMTDAGEPSTNDIVSMTVTVAGVVVESFVDQSVTAGNVQAHCH